MGNQDIFVPQVPFVYGGDPEVLCRECQLPCQLKRTSIDCFRRFFLQGLLKCTYFVYGYCFLVDEPGCIFDNGGEHESYWMRLLNDYFHNVKEVEETDPDFARHALELRQLVVEQIQSRRVYLCRYLEECYNRLMDSGGGMSEEMMEKLDEAYLSLLAGTSRKR